MMNSIAVKGNNQWNIQSAIDFKLLRNEEKALSTYVLLFSIFDFVFVCICCISFLHVCELFYIVSFVVKSPSGGKNP